MLLLNLLFSLYNGRLIAELSAMATLDMVIPTEEARRTPKGWSPRSKGIYVLPSRRTIRGTEMQNYGMLPTTSV